MRRSTGPALPWRLLFIGAAHHALRLLLPASVQLPQFPAAVAASFNPQQLATAQPSATTHTAIFNATFVTRIAGEEGAEKRLAALVQYLFSQSNTTKHYLMYDPALPGSAGAAAESKRHWNGVTLFRCSPSSSSSSSPLVWWLKSIRGALTEGYDPATHKSVLVTCTDPATSEIFSQVRQEDLESPSVHWYAVLEEEGAKEGILRDLREGTQVTAAARGGDGRYHLLSSYVDVRGEMAWQEVGWWSWHGVEGKGANGGGGGGTGSLEGPLTRLVGEQYKNLEGRSLRVCAVQNSPYFRVETLQDGSLQAGTGIDVNLLNILADKLNFTYRLVEAKDGQWGQVLANGSVTGMVGVVMRREADLTVDEITVTAKREKVVDFSIPYYVESTVLVSPAPKEKNRAFAAFSPFSTEVWAMVVVVTLVMGPLLAGGVWVRKRYLGNNSEMARLSLDKLWFTAFRSLVVQGNLLFPTYVPLRIVFLTWYLFCYVVYALYAGTLTAVLALPTYTKAIETLTDLLVAARRGDLHPAVVKGTSNAFLLMDAESGIYKDIWEVFDPNTGYAKNYDAGVDKVMEGPFVFINARLGSEVRAAARGIQRFYISRDSFYPQSYSVAFPTGSPIRVVVNPILSSITASGMVGKWMKDEVQKVTKSVEEEKSYAITLVHLQAAFFILLIGFLVAATALFLENVYHRYSLYRMTQGKGEPKPRFILPQNAFAMTGGRLVPLTPRSG